jgi:hypothetical protein
VGECWLDTWAGVWRIWNSRGIVSLYGGRRRGGRQRTFEGRGLSALRLAQEEDSDLFPLLEQVPLLLELLVYIIAYLLSFGLGLHSRLLVLERLVLGRLESASKRIRTCSHPAMCGDGSIDNGFSGHWSRECGGCELRCRSVAVFWLFWKMDRLLCGPRAQVVVLRDCDINVDRQVCGSASRK